MTAAPLVAALLLAGAPDPAGPAPAPPGRASLPPGDRVELVVRFPPWSFTGSFTFSVGGLADHGVARDSGSLIGPDRSDRRHQADNQVRRVLTGERGTLVLSLLGELCGGFPPVMGRWTVVSGTGAYAGLAGGGTFTAVDSGKGPARIGSPFELQTMLGRLARR